MDKKLAIIYGVHAQERGASYIAKPVSDILGQLGYDVALFKAPKQVTHLHAIRNPNQEIPFPLEFGCVYESSRMYAWMRRIIDEMRERPIFDIHNTDYHLWTLCNTPLDPLVPCEMNSFGPMSTYQMPHFAYKHIQRFRGLATEPPLRYFAIEMPAVYRRYEPLKTKRYEEEIERIMLRAGADRRGSVRELLGDRLFSYMRGEVDFPATQMAGFVSDSAARTLAEGIDRLVRVCPQ